MAKQTPVVNAVRSGDQGIDGILGGIYWNSANLTFSFPTSPSDYGTSATYGDPAPFNGMRPLSGQQQGDVFRTLGLVQSYTGLRFTQIQESPAYNATIRYANSSSPATSYAYQPDSLGTGGDAFFGATGQNPIQGNFDSGQTIIHETGHALGLKHAHESSVFGAAPANIQDIEYSVMNYANYIGSTEASATTGPGSSPQSYMQYDIAALQYMYGANMGSLSTNAVYSWSPTTGEEFINGASQGKPYDSHIFETVWTAGATSTYDFRNYSSNGSYDLRPGGAVYFSPNQIADLDASGVYGPGVKLARGNIYNALLYQGNTSTEVSTILTGNGDDAVYLNDVYDIVALGAGRNSVFAGRGGGTINGSGATNTLMLPGNRAEYAISSSSSTSLRVTDSVVARTGTENLQGVRYLGFADGIVDGYAITQPAPNFVQQTGDVRVAQAAGISFTIAANTFVDPGGGAISYSAFREDGTALPNWLVFDAAQRSFSGTAPGTVGPTAVKVVGTAINGKSGAEAFHIYTTPGTPTLLAQAGDQRLNGNVNFSFSLPQSSFSNPSSGPLVITAEQENGTALPSWISFDAPSGIFSGKTPAGGATLGIRIDATTPEGASTAEAFHVYANPLPPMLAQQTQDRRLDYASSFSFTLPNPTFTDPGGNTLAYSVKQPGAGALPTWITFDPASLHFSGTVPASVSGTPPDSTAVQAIEVDATDTQGMVSGEAFHLYLDPGPPKFQYQTNDQRLTTTTPFSFAIDPNTFIDPAGGPITYSAFQTNGTPLPAWITFNTNSDTFSGITPQSAGTLAIEVLATASSGRQAAEAFHFYTR